MCNKPLQLILHDNDTHFGHVEPAKLKLKPNSTNIGPTAPTHSTHCANPQYSLRLPMEATLNWMDWAVTSAKAGSCHHIDLSLILSVSRITAKVIS